MNIEDLQRTLLRDNYLAISFKKYLAFKETEQYDEAYKLEILSRLNEVMKPQEITERNVAEMARKIQKENPPAGSFVHWSNTGDLVKYAEERPEEVAELWNHLYKSPHSLEERIEAFREAGKAFNSQLSLGAPLFGYLLAAMDLEKYPLYKQEVFTDLKRSFGIELKLGTVGSNYETYYTVCQIALEHLQPVYPGLSMLDIQDFFFCSTQYHKIKVESAVEYLYGLAADLAMFKQSPEKMLDAISNLDSSTLQALRNVYQKSEKVNLIKFKAIEKIIEFGHLSIEELEDIKEDVKQRYDTNILQSWNNFTILFQLYYFDKKKKVTEEQRKIHGAIRQLEEANGLNFVEDKVLNGYSWNQNFGGSECWLAVYEKGHATHRTAPQFFVSIDENGIRYGLLYGDQHAKRGEDSLFITDNESFTYEEFSHNMRTLLIQYKEQLEGDVPSKVNEDKQIYAFPSSITAETWAELLHDETVVKKSDMEYLIKMLELGGGATATQLAQALDKHFSSFNTPVVQLAKRVIASTGVPVPHRENGEPIYWAILFDGEYTDEHHFKWILKPALKEALEKGREEFTLEATKEPYSKDDFLKEVFMDEEKYNTIANLLRYKKNMILQGPPGVGKTFVSKRLAYSLMGEKDDSRVQVVQFHQSYAYEDFVMGYRPDENGFSLQTGIFYDFCQSALENPDKDYYFIIDEINRGNLSKIFGELFMLIEGDKRDEYVTMGYSKRKFTVPANVYLIGTMNTADRSLAQLEVALRRRFAFVSIEPAFNEKWKLALDQQGVSARMIERILYTVEKINREIVEDYQLGAGYAIGHSFFGFKPAEMDENEWFQGIISFEISPLLEEYFYDRPEVARGLLEG
ncbi:AAA family ATPase [Neobacillus piezotolerans]|nr:AAA family ATPase [Neobacillus piezotolerans]